MPTIHDPREYGEKVVLRVLHSKTEEYNLQKLGMAPDIQAVVANRIKEPKGLILVTGPTGSGKTTTLYAMLMAINDGTKNIVTVEDPVEVPLSGITQISVNQQVDLTFARALRSVLRQDPDVILIGEIRDRETVDIALSATNTGHLAFATLHADDSPATLLRLQRLGVGGESIAPNLKAIMSQRLIRRACHDCLGKYDAKEELFYLLGGDFLKSEVALHQARPGNMGCRHCGGKGYFGRSLLLEYWGIAHKERQMILDGVEDRNAYIKVAMEHGFKPMIYLAIDALMNGKTDIAEIKRSAVTEEEFLRHGKHIGVMINHSIENLSEARPKEG
jgi:general secretion pathway protein E